MITDSNIDLAKKYVALWKKFADFSKIHHAELADTMEALNTHAPFFSLECWIDTRREFGYGRNETLIAMFFNRGDADNYVRDLMAEIDKCVVEGDPRIELSIEEYKGFTPKTAWRAARFGVSVGEGYKMCRRCIDEYECMQ